MPTNVFDQTVGEPVAEWSARAIPPRTPIEGRLCRIEPIDAALHADDLFEAFVDAPDARDWTYLPVERFDDRLAYRGFVEQQALSDDPRHNAILDKRTGRAVGSAALMRIDQANGVIEVGHIVFSPRLQRTAAATEAIFLIMCRVFDELGYRRLEWKCDSLNAPSRRAAERLGFSFEGIFRQAVVTKGRNRDTAWYAMTDGDWAVARGAFEKWLAPDNFDGRGLQKRPLRICHSR